MAAHLELSLQGCEAMYAIFAYSTVCCITMKYYICVFFCLLYHNAMIYSCIPVSAAITMQYYILCSFVYCIRMHLHVYSTVCCICNTILYICVLLSAILQCDDNFVYYNTIIYMCIPLYAVL